MYAYVHYERLSWDFLRSKKKTNKVDASKAVNAVAAAQCPSVSELIADIANARWHPGFPIQPP